MQITSARIVEKKESATAKENLKRVNAQPLLLSKIDDIKREHYKIKEAIQSQQETICAQFEGRERYIAKCWNCHSMVTLHVDRTEIVPFAVGDCPFCDTQIRHHKRLTIDAEWPNKIRDALFTKEQVGVRHLIDFMEEIGLADLSLEYRGTPVRKHYSGRDVAKRNADRDEQILAQMMGVHYRVKHHLNVAYKKEGDTKETHCFPDIVAGDDAWAFVLEVKMNGFDIKPEQLALYHAVIRHVVGNTRKGRSVATVAVCGNEMKAVKGEYTTLSELLHIREQEDLESHLILHATHISKWESGAYIDQHP
jgi:hypothetical protein